MHTLKAGFIGWLKASFYALLIGCIVCTPAQAQQATMFLGAPGNATRPTYSWYLDPDTGMYRYAANVIGFSAGGANALQLAIGSAIFPGQVRSDGTGARFSFIATGGASNFQVYFPAAGAVRIFNGGSTGTAFNVDSTGATVGVSLFGTATDSSNGQIQLTPHTTSAGGIGFGTDISLHRVSQFELRMVSTGSTTPFFRIQSSGGAEIFVQAVNTSDARLGSATNHPLLIQSNSTTAATVDTSQGVTWENKVLTKHPTAGIGYATGAGGTITQLTNKATDVTLNKVVGFVTMNNAALAANTSVTFNIICSAVAATDVVIAQHHSGGTTGAYNINCRTSAGAIGVDVRNLTAGSLSEAIVISYAIIKGASS